MPAGPFSYRADVRRVLLDHGVAPRPTTDPAQVRELLSALYVWEIRELRIRRLELERALGPQPLAAYARQLAALRERYALLGLPLEHWTER
ncbi:MAG TPA: hypothetical protein VGC93_02745 [Thermoanaerobaculia bacterium]